MTDRPIIFSTPMVRALLDGRKTQTRRVLKRKGYDLASCPRASLCDGGLIQFEHPHGGPYTCVRAPYASGDRLWVREAWGPCDGGACYRADEPAGSAAKPDDGRWRPSIHMPRWASRITLDVSDVRVQRLQEISEADAKAEGVRAPVNVSPDLGSTYTDGLGDLWESLHGDGSWDANPWVVAISFTVWHGNIDA